MRVYDNPRTTAANLRKSRFSREDKKPVLYGVGCLIPIALMLVAAPVACYHYFFSDAAFIRANGKTTAYRANFHCAIRGNDAMVVNGSYFVSDGSIDLFKKEGEEWRLTRHVDITKYLEGRLVTHINSDDIESYERYEYKTPIAFNDQFVVVLAWKSDVPKILHFDVGPGEGVGTALVFKRVGDDLKFFARISKLRPYHIALSDENYLLVAAEGRGDQIVLKEYDLNASRPKVVQTIEPPTVTPEEARNSHGAKEGERRSFRSDFIQKGDYLLVESRQFVPMDDGERTASRDDYLLYRKIDGEWRYVQSLLDHIPRETCQELVDPIYGLDRCDFGGERFQLSLINYLYDRKGLIEFQRDETTGLFEVANVDFKKFLKDDRRERRRPDSHDDDTRVNLVIQERNNASLAAMNKATRLGILPPSHDAPPAVAAPKWTILAGDSGTTAKMVDHYKEGKVSSFIPRYGHDDDYANFYDWSDAVPTLHYAINGSDMVVSYVFKDCFFSGWPMQDACDVWAGVDFYRIDDELGPIKVSGFTTRDLEPLAPRKTPESESTAVP